MTSIELRRHAPVGRPRRAYAAARPRGLGHLYASPKRRLIPDLYVADRAEGRRGGGFRWFFSTCLAASVGAIAIAAVVFGSMHSDEGRDGFIPALERSVRQPLARRAPPPEQGLRWASPKSDRLQATTGAMSTKYIVQETINQRRGSREYIHKKPYARIVIRLAAVTPDETQQIPRFDPVKLLATAPGGEPADSDNDGPRVEGGDLSVRVVELVGTILPTEDGQEMDNQEVADAVRRTTIGTREDSAIRPGFLPEGSELRDQLAARSNSARSAAEAISPNTMVVPKSTFEQDVVEDETETDGRRVKVKINRGETLAALLRRNGADLWLARSMVDAAKAINSDTISPDLEAELTLLPSLTQAGRLEPARLTLSTETGEHRLTIWRNAAGDFVASTAPIETSGRANQSNGQVASLYASLYHAGLAQGIPPDTIEQVLRVHATEIDFRRRARGSDGIELFFDLKEEDKGADSAPGDLLSTAMTINGITQRYYRFRTPDGLIDFYDENGSNSRKFLLRRPFRGDQVKFNNGYGMRHHPLLGGLRMHTGVDYAGPMHTPVLAAGSGVVEEARPKGQNGNYVRIRHANGYQTAYSHLSRFASGVVEGTRVVQGQVIGFLGSTGLSTGPHLHYEVLVGNRFVDPLKLPDQRERRLGGRQLAEFHRERARIEELMRRPPVRVAQIDARP
ncbi:MAG TPA: M23 family metallopeptidase [Hyphomicrobiaceae bacterium]|nr:M23 family metallopeptidase [Hyphomicrobiaceae bacterium]